MMKTRALFCLLALLTLCGLTTASAAVTGVKVSALPNTNSSPETALLIVDQHYPGHSTNDTFNTTISNLFQGRSALSVSNIVATNIWVTTLHAETNIFATNIFVTATNLFFTNLFVRNLAVTNLTINTNVFFTPTNLTIVGPFQTIYSNTTTIFNGGALILSNVVIDLDSSTITNGNITWTTNSFVTILTNGQVATITFNPTQFTLDLTALELSIRNQPHITNPVMTQVITLDGLAYSFPTVYQQNAVLGDISGAGVLKWLGSATNPLPALYFTNVFIGTNPVLTAASSYWTNVGGHLQPILLSQTLFWTNSVFWGPGDTNQLYRLASDLHWSNSALASFGFKIDHPVGGQAHFLGSSSGALITSGNANFPVTLEANGGTPLIVNPLALYPNGIMSLGVNGSPGPWLNEWFFGTLHQQGVNDGLGNSTGFEISHSGNAGLAILNSTKTGTGSYRPIMFQFGGTNALEIANDIGTWPNDATKYFDGSGHWSTPPGGGGGSQAVTNYFLAAGSNITLTTNTSGTNVTWTVAASGSGGTNSIIGSRQFASETRAYTNTDSIVVTSFGSANFETATLTAGQYLVTATFNVSVADTNFDQGSFYQLASTESGDIFGTLGYVAQLGSDPSTGLVNMCASVQAVATITSSGKIQVKTGNVQTGFGPVSSVIQKNGASITWIQVGSGPSVNVNLLLVTNNVAVLLSPPISGVVNMTNGFATNTVSAPITLTAATNGLSGTLLKATVAYYNGSGSDQALTIPASWKTNAFSPVPAALTNGTVTFVYLRSIGLTDSAARQTNVDVSFDYVQ